MSTGKILDDGFYARLRHVESILILHTQFKDAISRLQQAFEHVRNGAEPRHIFLIGESGTGKTLLAQYFASLYAPEAGQADTVMPVLYVPTPSSPTLKVLAESILEALGDPLGQKGTAFEKRERAIWLLRQRRVQFIFFDEFHHFLDHGKHHTLITVTDWLKRFIDDSQIPCALMGLPRCLDILRANEQLRRRFSRRIELQAFSIDTKEQEMEFRAVLHQIDQELPTEGLSGLANEDFAVKLYFASDGLIGYLRKLITAAFELLVANNQVRLTSEMFEQAFTDVIWNEGLREVNPFNRAFKPRRLNLSGEPFAIAASPNMRRGGRASR